MKTFQATVLISIDDSCEDETIDAQDVKDVLDTVIEDEVVLFTFQDCGLPSPSEIKVLSVNEVNQ